MSLSDAPRLGDHERKIKEEDLICLEHARGWTLGRKWTLKTRLSRRSFSQVYIAQRLKKKKFCIVKQESRETMRKHLWNEYEVILFLFSLKNDSEIKKTWISFFANLKKLTKHVLDFLQA